jgi:hypothetical protein
MKTLDNIFEALYKSEINLKVEWLWDGGYDFEFEPDFVPIDKLGKYGSASTIAELKFKIVEMAKKLYPDSTFAKTWKWD